MSENIYKICNNVGGYCYKGSKEECENYIKNDTVILNDISQDENSWNIVKDIQKIHKSKVKTKNKNKLSGQGRANLICKKIKHFNLKIFNGKEVLKIDWIGPYSGVYGAYSLFDIDGGVYGINSTTFKPNANDIDKIIPGYKNISRKKIK